MDFVACFVFLASTIFAGKSISIGGLGGRGMPSPFLWGSVSIFDSVTSKRGQSKCISKSAPGIKLSLQHEKIGWADQVAFRWVAVRGFSLEPNFIQPRGLEASYKSFNGG